MTTRELSRTDGLEGGWISHVLPGSVKIFITKYAIQKYYITPSGKSNGLIADKTQRLFASIVGDIFPTFPDYFKEHDLKCRPLGLALVHRARLSANLNELDRFSRPVWGPLNSLIDNVLQSRNTVHIDDLYAAQEIAIKAEFGDDPGVYLRQHYATPNEVYLGEGERVSDRGGRTDSAERMVAALATQNKEAARNLQNAIFSLPAISPFLVVAKRPSVIRFPEGIDAVSVIREQVRTYYRHFFRREVWSMGDMV